MSSCSKPPLHLLASKRRCHNMSYEQSKDAQHHYLRQHTHENIQITHNHFYDLRHRFPQNSYQDNQSTATTLLHILLQTNHLSKKYKTSSEYTKQHYLQLLCYNFWILRNLRYPKQANNLTKLF